MKRVLFFVSALLVPSVCAAGALFASQVPAPLGSTTQEPDGGSEGAVEPEDGEAVFESLDGSRRRLPVGELAGADLGGAAFVRFEGLTALPARNVASLGTVELIGGDRLSGQVLGLDEENLGLVMAGETHLTISIDDLLSLRFPSRLDADDDPPVAAESGDRLYRVVPRGVDRVDGLLVGFSAEGIAFEGRIGERTYPWKDVAALFVEPLDDGPVAQEGGQAVVVDLAGGDRLTGELQGLRSSGIELLVRGKPMSLPLGLVEELLVDNGRYAFLSWLPVADTGPTASPFDPPGAEPLGMVWPHQLDRSVTGKALRAGGQAWSRGIGVHAPSRLTWTLDGEWTSFRVLAAVDESKRKGVAPGSVRFRVWVDGKALYESPIARAGDAPLVVPSLSVEGAKELTLEVDDGGDGPVMDRANWLRPMLIRG